MWGGAIKGTDMGVHEAREAAQKAAPDARPSRNRCAWKHGGSARPTLTIGQCINGGYGWLYGESNRRKTRSSLPLSAIRRARDPRFGNWRRP